MSGWDDIAMRGGMELVRKLRRLERESKDLREQMSTLRQDNTLVIADGSTRWFEQSTEPDWNFDTPAIWIDTSDVTVNRAKIYIPKKSGERKWVSFGGAS